MTSNKFAKFALAGVLATGLSACGDDDETSPMVIEEPVVVMPVNYSFEVNVLNLTYAQPLSPVFVAAHTEGALWEIGSPASTALEMLAESGSGAELAALATLQTSMSGTDAVMPSQNDTVSVTLTDTMPALLTVVTMLVNTNDAFTGYTGIDVSGLNVGDSMTYTVGTYDAGTEANSEMMGTIPGPADGGEGFNAARDDVDFVAMHSGVVSKDDGLTTSVLTQMHRFDNPTMRITVTRTE